MRPLALLAPLAASALLGVWPTAAATVVVDDTDWRPWYFAGAPNQPPGFAKEVLDGCLRSLGHRPEYVAYPILRMYDALKRGEIDLHVMSRRADREEYLVFGEEPLFTARYRPILRADDPREIHGIEDFDGLRLGHVRGLRYSDEFLAYLDARIAEGTVEETVSNESALRMLVANRIDVVVNLAATARWFAKELGILDQIRILPLDIRSSDYFVVVSRNSDTVPDPHELARSMDACIAELKTTPTWHELTQRYQLEPEP